MEETRTRTRQCLWSPLSLVTGPTRGLEPWTQAHVAPQDVNSTSGSFNALTCWSTHRTPKPGAMPAKPNALCRGTAWGAERGEPPCSGEWAEASWWS